MTNEVAYYLASYLEQNCFEFSFGNEDTTVDMDVNNLAKWILNFFEELP